MVIWGEERLPGLGIGREGSVFDSIGEINVSNVVCVKLR